MSDFVQDLRFARRVLAKTPGFTAAAALTLALGIGANTAIFSAVNAVLLRQLPYQGAERLMSVYPTSDGSDHSSFSPADYLDLAGEAKSFSGLAAFSGRSFNLVGEGEPERLDGTSVSRSFFDVLGVKTRWGTGFTQGADGAGAEVILSHGLWQRRFGGDPALVGRTVTLSGDRYTVVGVLPAGFRFAPQPTADVFVRSKADIPAPPIPLEQDVRTIRGLHWFRAIGRLAPGATPAAARTEVDGIGRRLAAAYPESNADTTFGAIPLRKELVGDLRPALLTLLAAVALVLLIACTNVANLLLARTLARGRGLAIRSTLGAGPFRLLRQLLAESFLLALLGGGAGLVLGYWGVEALTRLAPPSLAGLSDLSLDGRILAFTAAVSMGSVLLFGLVPAWLLSRPASLEALKAGTRTTAGSRTGILRSLLVVAETALALVLLVGAGLLVRSFVALQRVDPGFDPNHLLTFSVALPQSKYDQPARLSAFYAQALDRLRALPGVESAGAVLSLPMSQSNFGLTFSIEGRPDPPPGKENATGYQLASSDYFKTLSIPVVAGRPFRSGDGEAGRKVALINQAMAHKFFRDEDPIGRRFAFGTAGEGDELEWLTILGVVGDVRHFALDQPVRPEAYVPFAQDPWPFAAFALRTQGDPMALAEAARHAILEIDADQPVARLRPMTDYLANSVAQRRFVMVLIGIFAALAAVLAALGIYGVIAYSVSQRTHEIGIRLALGAGRRLVLADVLGRGMALVGAGVAIGAVVALAVSRLVANQLYSVGAADPVTYLAVSLLLAGVALLASLLPARRASRVEPMVALRQQ
jgi:putative ABC transport system permease protein